MAELTPKRDPTLTKAIYSPTFHIVKLHFLTASMLPMGAVNVPLGILTTKENPLCFYSKPKG